MRLATVIMATSTQENEVVVIAFRGMINEGERQDSADILKWWTLMAMGILGELSLGNSFDMVRIGNVCQMRTI